MGLFIGFSFISCAEIFYFGVIKVYLVARKQKVWCYVVKTYPINIKFYSFAEFGKVACKTESTEIEIVAD